MPSNHQINEPIGVINPKVITARWVPIGGCVGVTGTARAGTTGKLVKTCGAGTATNIAITTGIAVDTAIGIGGVTATVWAGTTAKLATTCGAGTVTNITTATRIGVDTTIGAGISRTESEIIEAMMKIGVGGA